MENKIILLAAISKDNFIADQYGNGDFSSIEDKQQFREFLHSNQCDCFVCGRKTAEEFNNKLTYKPLFILTNKKRSNSENCCYIFNIQELLVEMNKRRLSVCALLGGAQTYHYFLKNNMVDEIRLTKENLIFKKGLKLSLKPYLPKFKKINTYCLSQNTKVFIFQKKQKTR